MTPLPYLFKAHDGEGAEVAEVRGRLQQAPHLRVLLARQLRRGRHHVVEVRRPLFVRREAVQQAHHGRRHEALRVPQRGGALVERAGAPHVPLHVGHLHSQHEEVAQFHHRRRVIFLGHREGTGEVDVTCVPCVTS